MALDFPSSPSVEQTYTSGGKTWKWDGLKWVAISAAAIGGGTDAVFVVNDQTVSSNYTLAANKNAMTASPISILSGVTVTVSSGACWTVV